jgi:hypothetical protein
VAVLIVDKRNSVACGCPTALGPVNVNAENGYNQPQKKIFIPDLLVRWPFPRRLNHYYPKVRAESSAWLESFKAFSPKAQQAFDRCNFGKTWFITNPPMYSRPLSDLLSCLAYPIASEGKLYKDNS